MNMLAHREKIGGRPRLDSASPGAKDVAKLLGAHRRVVLVLDLSDDDDAILRELTARAWRVEVDVNAIVVLPEWSACAFEERTREFLTRVAQEVTTPLVRVSADVRLGEPVPIVLEAAERHDADLIAMTAHRVGVIDRLLNLSVLEEVLRRAPVPVVALSAH